jgi:hypothetical protein
MLAAVPADSLDLSRNGCDRTSSTPVKSSASSSDRSSSDSNPCSRPVDTMNCSPGRWRCRCRQVNRRTGSHPATGTSPRSRAVHATSPPEIFQVDAHRRDHPGPRPSRPRSASVP